MTLDLPVTEAAKITVPDAQTVTSVTKWTDSLFSFRVTRPASLRFRSGEFVMIGLPGDNGKPLLRAYSIASPNWDDELEFYSIIVPDGPLTSKLQHIKPGDKVRVRIGNLTMTNHPIHLHGHEFVVAGTDGGWTPPGSPTTWPRPSRSRCPA